VKAGVRWARPDAFRRDVDVEAEYRELRESGSVTFELVQHATRPKRRLFGRAPFFQFHADAGGGRRTIERRFDALVRRAAEDGFAVHVTETEQGWVRERAAIRRRVTAWRERRTLALDGPLPAEIADPIGTLQAGAATLYDELRREGSIFFRYSYSKHALLVEQDPDAVLFRELERLARAEGFVLAGERCDDIGDFLHLVPAGQGPRTTFHAWSVMIRSQHASD